MILKCYGVLPGDMYDPKKIIYGVSKSTAQYLREKGVKIYFYSKGFIHSKTVLIDGEFAFVGTINLDYRSLSHHFENGVVTYKTTAVKGIKKDFENIFSVSEIATEKNCKVNKFTRLINAFLAAFRPLL
jgi:cardiolipin synthase